MKHLSYLIIIGVITLGFVIVLNSQRLTSETPPETPSAATPTLSAEPTKDPANPQRQAYRGADGSLKYSEGTCSTDAECVPAGCSSQICSNDPDIITTCEIRDDFPDTDIYSCGCVENTCAWYE
jgi:eight-cysteine-cluster-containing protein